jgi:hypothetical protein
MAIAYSFLARTIRSSSFVQVWSVIVPPMMLPISVIIFDAASIFDDNFSDNTSETAALLFAALSAVHAAWLTVGNATATKQTIVKVLNTGELLRWIRINWPAHRGLFDKRRQGGCAIR